MGCGECPRILKDIKIHRGQRFEWQLAFEERQITVQNATRGKKPKFLEGAEVSITQHRNGGQLRALRNGLREKLMQKLGALPGLQVAPENVLHQ